MSDGSAPKSPTQRDSGDSADILADLLDEALALDTEAREVFLRGLEGRDAARAGELRELIAHLPDPESREAADRVERGESDPFVGEPAVGDTIGGCVIEDVIGRGGIGTVFGARQLDPPRAVAVKVLRLANARASHLRRFRTEAYALGRLLHPALARIYASGTERRSNIDLPYIVMERIDGAVTFVDWARAPRRTRHEIALRMAEICDGMQHGHSRGVIHRDLKPTNILIGGDDRPHVIDFGIARLVSGDPAEQDETVAGSLIGTPAYMAPEQFELAPLEVDTRIDIHALGVILYESLTGRRPYDIPRHLYFDAAQIMRSVNPAMPHLVDATIPRDLSAIAMKAMAKDRDRRYASMSEFADDLRAFAASRSVRARPESGFERVLRAARNNPAWTTAAVISTAALITAGVVAFGSLRQARADRDRLRLELATIDAERGLIPLEGDRPLDIDSVEPALVSGMIHRFVDEVVFPSIAIGTGNAMAGALSPDRSRWVVGSDGGQVAVIDFPADGSPPAVSRLSPVTNSAIYAVGCSWDGSVIYAADVGGRFLRHESNGSLTPLLTLSEVLRGILPCSDGDRMLLVGPRSIGVFRQSTGKAEFAELATGFDLGGAAWLGQGPAYAVMGDRRVIAVEVPEQGAPRLIDGFRLNAGSARSVGVSPDGLLVAVGNDAGRVHIADARTGAVEHVCEVRHSVWSVAFSRDGALVFAGDRGGRVHTIDASTGRLLDTSSVNTTEPAWALAATRDGVLAASIGHFASFLGAGSRWSLTPQSLPVGPRSVRMIGDRAIRVIGEDGVVRELDIGEGVWRERGRVEATRAVAQSRDGRFIATVSSGILRVHEPASGSVAEHAIEADPAAPISRIDWNEDATLVAILSRDRLLIHSRDAKPVASTPVGQVLLGRIAWYAADRLYVLTTATDGVECILEGGQIRTAPRKQYSSATVLRSDGRWVFPSLSGTVGVTSRGGAEVIPASAIAPPIMLRRHRDIAPAAAISPDGTMIATGGGDGTIRLWWLETGAPITTFTPHQQIVSWLGWLPDGSGIVSIGANGETRLLDSIPLSVRLARDRAAAATARP